MGLGATPEDTPEAMVDTVVIGGGLLGTTIAYYLAKAGTRVHLVDAGQINGQASSQNAGSLHFQLEYRMIENGEAAARQAARAMPLHLHAQQAWATLPDEIGRDMGVKQTGGLMLAETDEQCAKLKRKVALERESGLDIEFLERDALRAKAPFLSQALQAAAFCPGEGKADPKRSAFALASAASSLGATVESRRRVSGLTPKHPGWSVQFDDGSACTARTVVIAAGVWSARLAQMAGVVLPVSPVGLTMTATARTAPFLPYLIQHVGKRLSLKQTPEGTVLIGGGWPAKLHQADGVVDLERRPALSLPALAGNMQAATSVVPHVGRLQALRVWTGMTALVSDQLPLIGPIQRRHGLFVATGGSAFTLGPTYARIIADQILGSTPPFDVSAYAPSRFGSLTFA